MNTTISKKKNSSLNIPIIFIVIVIISLVASVFFTTPINDKPRGFIGFESDGLAYATMAGAHLPEMPKPENAPWCYRVLTPYLVSLLPWSILQNFRFLAFMSNILSLFVLFSLQVNASSIARNSILMQFYNLNELTLEKIIPNFGG
ncbi:MAG: hypothetical protein ABIJ59_19040 [Pseudomonadota bacterium]